jgi:hypothetical protein
MATATKQTSAATQRVTPYADDPVASGTPMAPAATPPVSENPDRRREHRCECGHVLRVSGGGRHRVYFELGDARLTDPVMNRVCPACGRGLPGKNY